jgi:hypothetical protein
MKKIFAGIATILMLANVGITAYAAENLNRDYIESEIWDEMWQGKGDDGLEFPEASYKHYLLDEWLDENYGSDDYDWTDLGELKYAYKDYYRDYIEDFDFNDDDNGNWTIDTEDNSYSFYILNGMWQMVDENGDTVDSFPPFSTLEEDEKESKGGYEINNNGADSPRVIGKVETGTESGSESLADEGGKVVDESVGTASEGDSVRHASTLPIVAGAAVVAVIGAVRIYVYKKKK